MFKSLIDLAGDVATVVTAPVEMAIDVTDAVVKPIAEAAEEMVNDIKSLKE